MQQWCFRTLGNIVLWIIDVMSTHISLRLFESSILSQALFLWHSLERDTLHILTTCLPFQGIPIGLVVLGIVSFKTGRFEEMFDWTTTSSSYHYMPRWVSGHLKPSWIKSTTFTSIIHCGVEHPLSPNVLLCFLSEVPVTNRAAQ